MWWLICISLPTTITSKVNEEILECKWLPQLRVTTVQLTTLKPRFKGPNCCWPNWIFAWKTHYIQNWNVSISETKRGRYIEPLLYFFLFRLENHEQEMAKGGPSWVSYSAKGPLQGQQGGKQTNVLLCSTEKNKTFSPTFFPYKTTKGGGSK